MLCIGYSLQIYPLRKEYGYRSKSTGYKPLGKPLYDDFDELDIHVL